MELRWRSARYGCGEWGVEKSLCAHYKMRNVVTTRRRLFSLMVFCSISHPDPSVVRGLDLPIYSQFWKPILYISPLREESFYLHDRGILVRFTALAQLNTVEQVSVVPCSFIVWSIRRQAPGD
jgi:hypothetical protein